MSGSITGPSRPRSHTVGSIITSKEGWEHNLVHSSQHKPQYTSGKKIPVTPTPSHSSSAEADLGITTVAVAGDLGSNENLESPSGSNQQEEPRPSRSRFVALYHKYNPQLIFENRGSTARDHLASERTFLAYVRTSLALASNGVALSSAFHHCKTNIQHNQNTSRRSE